MSDLFEAFRLKTTASAGSTASSSSALKGSLRCVLDALGGDAILYVESDDGTRPDPLPSPRSYSGPWRDLLAALTEIGDARQMQLGWEEKEKAGGIPLSRYPYILSLAAATECLELPDGSPVEVIDETVGISISGENPYRGQLVSGGGTVLRNPRGIAENFILDGKFLYRGASPGPGYRSLRHLCTILTADELPRYISLAHTHFPGMPLDFCSYEVVDDAEAELQEGIIFHEMDREGFLHIQAVLTYPGYPPDFFTSYDAGIAAEIDHTAETIRLKTVTLPDPGPYISRLRRRIQRRQKSLNGSDGFFVDGSRISMGPRLAEAFIEMDLPALGKQVLLYGTGNLARFKILTPQPRVSMRISGGTDLLRGECRVNLGDESFSPDELIEIHDDRGFIQLNDGSKAILDGKFLNRLKRILKTINGDEVTLSFFDLPLIQDLIDEPLNGPGAVEPERVFRGFESLEKRPAPVPLITGTLRDYQDQGYRWLYYLYKTGLGGCLADDMGLGKTVQTISLLSAVHSNPGMPSLIVLPKSLIFNWEAELEKFCPGLSVYAYYGAGRDWSKAGEADIILTTYTIVRNEIQQLRKRSFRYLILDEAQNIKNLTSRISRAVLLLNGEYKLAISGTPLENNLMELYSLFRFLNPGMFGTIKEFQKNYANPIQRDSCQITAEDLRRKIRPFLLRRLKNEVAKDLPEKVEQVLMVEMDDDQRSLYESRREYYFRSVQEKVERDGLAESQIYILQAISELRQIASAPESRSSGIIRSPKRSLMTESLSDVFANHHKAVVFSNYLQTLDSLASDLDEMQVEYLFLTGSTADRKAVVQQFQQDRSKKVLLMTLKAGGVGLNLTVAHYVYLLDPWWNVAAENQAIDRCHRIGQKNTVFAYRLIARDSIEERILELQQKKRELFQSVIHADSGPLKSLTRDDLDFILG